MTMPGRLMTNHCRQPHNKALEDGAPLSPGSPPRAGQRAQRHAWSTSTASSTPTSRRPPSTPLPCPGAVHGLYPQRADTAAPWLARRSRWPGGAWRARHQALHPAQAALPRIRRHQATWASLNPQQTQAHLLRLRALLGRHGWQHTHLRDQALAAAAAALQRTLGRNPYDTQLVCAQLLLHGHLAEMSTGEGKTLAVALAAAVAALAGVPVHVMTANDYLVARDAEHLAPFFAALGLRNGAVCARHGADERRAAHACDVTHSTAREVAFDHLRDRQLLQAWPSDLQQRAARLHAADADASCPSAAPPAARPVLRGLCMALVDEADSLLIDEATQPLVLAETVDDPGHRARCVQALALARALGAGSQAEAADPVGAQGSEQASEPACEQALVHVHPQTLQVSWTEAALRQIETQSAHWGADWQHSAQRQDLVGQALVALHGLQRDLHYIVREAAPDHASDQATEDAGHPNAEAPARGALCVELLDAHTGRRAQGRQWSRELNTLVELKEGCTPSPRTRTCAQTSYQRFFGRYLHLAGTSGTLAECQRELAAVYGLQVVQVPLRTPSQRRLWPSQWFANPAQRAHAVVQRVRALVAQGRPVLVGVANVAQARSLCTQLANAGIPHQVLDAHHDAAEAHTVAQAGQRATVTVATAMAGRGTDIELGPGVAAAGGLHVLLCQDNDCARLDRQFIGRAGRQGDPGSAEIWRAGPAQSDAQATATTAAAPSPATPAWNLFRTALAWAANARQAWQHRSFETREMRRRRRLLEQDLSWEKKLTFTQLHA